MRTFLVFLVVLFAAWTFGPQLFQGELRIHGAKNPEKPAWASREPEPVAPAVYGPDGDSPIFPEPKPRPRAPKAQTQLCVWHSYGSPWQLRDNRLPAPRFAKAADANTNPR